jgi:hypothetical protein
MDSQEAIPMKNPDYTCNNIYAGLRQDEVDTLTFRDTELIPVLEPLRDEKSGRWLKWRRFKPALQQRAVQFISDPDEATKIIEYGMEMERGKGLFKMIGHCGMLDENNVCRAGEDLPEVCKGYMQKTGEKSYPRRSTPVEVTPRQLPLFDQ